MLILTCGTCRSFGFRRHWVINGPALVKWLAPKSAEMEVTSTEKEFTVQGVIAVKQYMT